MTIRFEDALKRFVVVLGSVVEKAIDHVQSAKKRVDSGRGVKPVLSIDSQILPDKIIKMIEQASDNIVRSSIPDIKNMSAVVIGEDASQYAAKFSDREAAFSLGIELNPMTQLKGQQRHKNIKASSHRLPLKEELFDYALVRFATPHQGDMSSSVQELGRIMKTGGRGLFIDYHPYGLYSQKGSQKLRSSSTVVRGVEDYYRIFKKGGMRVVEVREAWIDESMRSIFSEEEIPAYRSLKGTPLAIFVFFYKPKRQ